MSAEVSASTKIRPRSLPNVDDDRLLRRLAWLRVNGPALARKADARIEVRHLARQIHECTIELGRRGVPHV